MDSTLETIRFNSEEIKVLIKALESDQEAFLLIFNEYQNAKAHVSTMNPVPDKVRQYLHSLEQQLQDKDGAQRRFQVHIVEKLRSIYLRLHHLIHEIHNTELMAWKRNQQLAGNGYPNFDAKRLDLIQSWCDDLAEIAWANFNQNKEMKRLIGVIAQYVGERPQITEALNELNGKFTELLSFLLTKTFVIEKQPPQVMKTNTKFSAKVRLLVGGKLNLYMSPPQVQVHIISEQQADLLTTAQHKLKGEVSGEILNNTGTMQYDQVTQQLSITFQNLQLKKIRRAEKRGSESVVDEKFALCFSSKFKVNGEIDAYVYCLSLPVAVIVHGNQESHAWAAITWDNAFAEPARIPFVVPDKVKWGSVANALHMKFLSLTGKGLSEDDLNYLAEKVFKVQSNDYNNMQLSWSQFCKDYLPERHFTFWDWFYSIIKLTKDHLRPLWVDGAISGFVRKKQAEEILSKCVSGTFLLRFSDSELGGITVAWVGADRTVNMVAPFTARDFHIRGLADRLDDLMHLEYLYPQIPKKKAFEKYYTPSTESACQMNNGYVLPMLITHLPGFSVTPKVENTNNLQNDLNLLNDAAVNIDDRNICFPEANSVEAFENLMGNAMDMPFLFGFGNMP